MFIALLGMVLAGSRLLYAFGRDGLLSKGLGKMNARNLPANGVWTLAIVAIVIGAFFPFAFLAQLISAGTLIAYKMPFYPVLPALGFIGSLFVFWGLDVQAKLYSGIWFLIGILIYFAYGNRRSRKSEEK